MSTCERSPQRAVLSFDRGTILLKSKEISNLEESGILSHLVWDERVHAYRGQASDYHEIVQAFGKGQIGQLQDSVYKAILQPEEWQNIALRPYQEAALVSWDLNDRLGIISLPTGAGKTRVGMAAMASVGGPALCLVPTRVLLEQWVNAIKEFYQGPVGIIGDGRRTLEAVTVCTFESAYRNMSWLGDKFQTIVVDEAHHFGRGLKDEALVMAVAPYRLGLTATRPEEKEQVEALTNLIGPTVYEVGIHDLVGRYLAEFKVIRIPLAFTPEERVRYDREYELFKSYYRAYIARHPTGNWQGFHKFAYLSASGRKALSAFYRSRRLTSFSVSKRRYLGKVLAHHSCQKALVFTADTEAALQVSREFLLPVITSDIGRQERQRILGDFRAGRVRGIVACKVLNEGVDVPDADLAIILGGSSNSREHIQRIGRLLRPTKGKQALIYEFVLRETHEVRHANARGKSLVKAGATGKPHCR